MTTTSQQDLQEYYDSKALEHDEIALTYDHASAYKRYFYRSRFQAIIQALGPVVGESVLDLGCGTGYYTKALVNQKARVTASEFSQVYLHQARAYVGDADVRYHQASATDLPFKSGTFDVVLFTEIIEHIPEYTKALTEIHRVLKPGGRAVITTPSRYSPMNIAYNIKRWKRKYAFNEHVHEFTPAELRSLLAASFTVSSLRMTNYVVPYPFDLLIVPQTDDHGFWVRAVRSLDRLMASLPLVRQLGWTMIFTVRKDRQ